MPDTAVLDTNVWLDWLVFDDPGIALLRGAVADGALVLLATQWMRAELLSVLERPLILARRPDAPRGIDQFDRLIRLCEPAPRAHLVCSDPADQSFIDLASHQRARWLLTKDRALLRLARGARARHALSCPLAFQVGTPTIFTVMSALGDRAALATVRSVNLGQGFPDFDCDPRLLDAVERRHAPRGHNQYPPMTGVAGAAPGRRGKIEALYGAATTPTARSPSPPAPRRRSSPRCWRSCAPGDEVIVIEPVYDSYLPNIALAGGVAVQACR
jgi:predicted nucleic acid-binding protein